MTEEIKPQEEKENLSEAEYSKKSEFSKALLVEKAMDVIKERRSKEMKEGYYNFIPIPNGDYKKIYIPDTRKEFVGSVDYLKSILAPEIEVNEDMKKIIESINKKKKECLDKNSVFRRIVDGGKVLQSKEKHMPEMDDSYPILMIGIKPFESGSKEHIDYRKGFNNYGVRKYWDEMVVIHDELLAQLNILLSSKKINYFKQKTGY